MSARMPPPAAAWRALAVALLALVLLAGCGKPPANDWQALLTDKDYGALEEQLARLQDGYEQGGVSDLQLRSAWRAFDRMPPRAAVLLDEWVALRPSSYFARLARGYHHRSQAWWIRGDTKARAVGREQWARVKEELKLAGEDAQASLALRRKPVLSLYLLFDAAGMTCDRKALDEYFTLSQAYAGHSTLLYARRMLFLEPGWCGSYEEMEALRRHAAASGLPPAGIEQLQAIIDDDKGRALMQQGRPEEAVAHLRSAAEVGERAGPQFVRESLYGVRAYACKVGELRAWCSDEAKAASGP